MWWSADVYAFERRVASAEHARFLRYLGLAIYKMFINVYKMFYKM